MCVRVCIYLVCTASVCSNISVSLVIESNENSYAWEKNPELVKDTCYEIFPSNFDNASQWTANLLSCEIRNNTFDSNIIPAITNTQQKRELFQNFTYHKNFMRETKQFIIHIVTV